MNEKTPLNEFLRDEADRLENEANEQVSTAKEAPEGASATQEENADQGQEAQPAKAEEQPLEPPSHWDAADKETFKSQPRAVQEWALKRDKAVEGTITKKTQELAEQRKAVEPLLAATSEHDGYLKSIGVAPDVAFRTLVATERLLRTGTPEQKANAIVKLISDYAIDVNQVGAAPQQNTNPQPDNQLYTRLSQLEQNFNGITAQQVGSQVEAFASAKDAAGQSLHPHFEEVRAQMGNMVGAGDTRSLPEIYADACWAVPAVRDKLLSEKLAAERAALTEPARKAAAQARKANNVNVRPESDGKAKPKLSLRDEIAAIADEQVA